MELRELTTTNTQPATTEKPKLTFARHETFHLRDGWMYKGLQAVKHNSQVMLDKQGHHHLGLGINMFKSMKYWLQATALVRLSEEKSLHSRSFELTNLG
ncbi:MAG: Protein of unknown function (DUF4007), partial [Chloroflexi bacterium]